MDPTWEFQAPQFVDFNHLDEVEEQLRVSEGKVRGIAEAMVTGVTL